MLYAQNGATDAKLRHDEHRQKVRVSGKKSTVSDLDPDLGTVAHGFRGSPDNSRSPEILLRGGSGRRRRRGPELVVAGAARRGAAPGIVGRRPTRSVVRRSDEAAGTARRRAWRRGLAARRGGSGSRRRRRREARAAPLRAQSATGEGLPWARAGRRGGARWRRGRDAMWRASIGAGRRIRTCPSAGKRRIWKKIRVSRGREIRKTGGLFIGISGARRVQMRCGFWPRDRDRTL